VSGLRLAAYVAGTLAGACLGLVAAKDLVTTVEVCRWSLMEARRDR